eukprot:1946325-Amphidinium_carterae.1
MREARVRHALPQVLRWSQGRAIQRGEEGKQLYGKTTFTRLGPHSQHGVASMARHEAKARLPH